ncbi:ABC transporter substrate-binding protein [Gryllotalpicola reticulitermitis]|uniref:ABC transporter substrate-binding protein n=1 Tax=Gryllotalpicola reticulitermitis TaxID=1184153 RepID=A0ABV8Q458_9MICO
MNSLESFKRRPIARREFLALGGAAALLPLLAACTGGGSNASTSTGGGDGSKGPITFWDGVGPGQFNAESKTVTEAYAPKKGLPKASYQVITTPNTYEGLQAAIAAGNGPAVSGGYAFQAFQFANEGAIAYADTLVANLKKAGIYDDYPASAWAPFKTSKGYVAAPWGFDIRVPWVNQALLNKAGVDALPTDWDSWLAAAKSLAKIGVYGFGTAASASSAYGGHAMVSLMINNGGGLYDENGKPDATYSRNVEAMDFVRELHAAGAIDPGSVSYTDQNLYDSFKNRKTAIGFTNATLPALTSLPKGELVMPDPIKGPHGDVGTLQYLKNYMMYTHTTSQAGSEAFMQYWLQAFIGANGLFAKGDTGALPIRKSVIALPQYQSDPNTKKVLEQWEPIAKGYSARGTTLFASLAAADNGTAVQQFAQTMLEGKTDSKTALATLQKGLLAVSS